MTTVQIIRILGIVFVGALTWVLAKNGIAVLLAVAAAACLTLP